MGYQQFMRFFNDFDIIATRLLVIIIIIIIIIINNNNNNNHKYNKYSNCTLYCFD